MKIKPKNKFDINEGLRNFARECVFQTQVIEKNREPSLKDGFYFMKSPYINIVQYEERLDCQIDSALRSLESNYETLINMGLNITLHSLEWHNVKDSCFNIMGDMGLFIIKYKIENKL